MQKLLLLTIRTPLFINIFILPNFDLFRAFYQVSTTSLQIQRKENTEIIYRTKKLKSQKTFGSVFRSFSLAFVRSHYSLGKTNIRDNFNALLFFLSCQIKQQFGIRFCSDVYYTRFLEVILHLYSSNFS